MIPAFKFSSTFGADLLDIVDGRAGYDSGGVLLRRLMGLWPDSVALAGDGSGVGDRVVRTVSTNDSLIINFDVLTSPSIYLLRKSDHWQYPKIVNFVWFNVSEFSDEMTRRQLAWSCSCFPTFCNSERTSREIIDLIRKLVGPRAARDACIGWANLGIDLSSPPCRRATVPVLPTIGYPAMWLFDRKRPRVFLDIVDTVAAVETVQVEMRLATRHLGHDIAMEAKKRPYVTVNEIVPREKIDDYLRGIDVFVATAVDESYGIQYLELLHAGAVGVFPDRAWVRTLLPAGYPYLYKTTQGAKEMTVAIVRDLRRARNDIDSVHGWIERHHATGTFDGLFRSFCETQFETAGGRVLSY